VPFETGFFRCPKSTASAPDIAALRQSESPIILLGESEPLRAVLTQLTPQFRTTLAGPGFAVLQASSLAHGAR
jgi:hypothetical protein